VFAEAAAEAGLENARPYDLRHSFVSLLIAEGASIVEIARQAGHSPTMALSTYAHVIEELEGAERRPAAAVIREARDELVPLTYPRAEEQRRG
jgi:integrase